MSARELGIGDEALRLWLTHADLDAGKRSDGLTSDEQEEALYDGEGQRVQQLDTSSGTHTTTQHTYVGGTEDLASQWPNAGGAITTTTTAYYGGVAESVNGALSYTLSDGLGSVSASVNSSGTVSATQLYGPYGAARYHSGTLPTDYAFTHQRADATSGLDYYGAR